jgi:uncharacterized protein (DUF849 family)
MTEPYTAFAKQHVIIMSAPNGARRSREDHPALPITARQLAEEARQLLEQQVAVFHLHVRDSAGGHSLDPEHYRAAISSIREAVGKELVIQVTSESVGIYQRHQQMEMVRALRPEAVSLALRELCPDSSSEPEAARFYAFLQAERIWPQHILYTAGEVARFDELRRRGVLAQEHPFCLLVLGNYAGAQEGTVEELAGMRSMADFGEFPWGACCFGANEHQTMLETTALGGHVRLGFENNLCLPNGRQATNNAQLIHQYRQAITQLGRIPASSEQVRDIYIKN